MAKKNAPGLESHVSGQSNKRFTRPAHALPYTEVIDQIHANQSDGLTEEDAKRRLNEYGRNELDEGKGVQPVKILVRQVANAMTLVMRTKFLY
jgi:P-type Na+/K+ transporter